MFFSSQCAKVSRTKNNFQFCISSVLVDFYMTRISAAVLLPMFLHKYPYLYVNTEWVQSPPVNHCRANARTKNNMSAILLKNAVMVHQIIALKMASKTCVKMFPHQCRLFLLHFGCETLSMCNSWNAKRHQLFYLVVAIMINNYSNAASSCGRIIAILSSHFSRCLVTAGAHSSSLFMWQAQYCHQLEQLGNASVGANRDY